MANDDDPKLQNAPFALGQNPAPNPLSGQGYQNDRQQLVNDIMSAFRTLLPSNYVAKTNGPWYSLQFQAMAEQLADIQIQCTEIFKDSSWDFTRPDFLWQTLGSLVFPGATDKSGIPQIDGDTPYRDFLKTMVLQLLKGATVESIEGGIGALDPDFIVTITERYLETPPRDPSGAFTIEDQFIIDIFAESSSGGFPVDPFVTQQNALLVLAALKPAHVLCAFSYLFRDEFEQIADDSAEGAFSWLLEPYYYDDLRKWCFGAKHIEGDSGQTLSLRNLFSDPSVSFVSIRPGAILQVTSGANAGQYVVSATMALLSGADSTARSYTTSSGGSGSDLIALTPEVLQADSQDWGSYPIDETITVLDGPNAGTYRLDTVLGSTGGPMGTVGVSGDKVRISQSILKITRRMPSSLSGQSYSVGVDRLGIQLVRTVEDEDVSNQFWD